MCGIKEQEKAGLFSLWNSRILSWVEINKVFVLRHFLSLQSLASEQCLLIKRWFIFLKETLSFLILCFFHGLCCFPLTVAGIIIVIVINHLFRTHKLARCIHSTTVQHSIHFCSTVQPGRPSTSTDGGQSHLLNGSKTFPSLDVKTWEIYPVWGPSCIPGTVQSPLCSEALLRDPIRQLFSIHYAEGETDQHCPRSHGEEERQLLQWVCLTWLGSLYSTVLLPTAKRAIFILAFVLIYN